MTTLEDDYRKYFDVLELSPGASTSEVREAYMRLRKLYSSDSIALSSLESELSEDWKARVLNGIEDAYAKLMELFERMPYGERKERKSVSSEEIEAELEGIRIFSGSALRRIREKLGVDLHEIAHATKINKQYLGNIEDEKFAFLPEKVFIRGYLLNYAKYLSLDPKRVTTDYMNLYSAWEKSRGEK